MNKSPFRWTIGLLVSAVFGLTAAITFCAVPLPGAPGASRGAENQGVHEGPFEPVKILVANSLKLDFQGEPVSLGIPLKLESATMDTGALAISDAKGNVVAAQFRVLARWGSLQDQKRPIKWLLADFLADAPASGPGVYYLKRAARTESSASMLREDKKSISVDTGKVSFRVGKGGRGLFQALALSKGEHVTRSDGYNGFVLKRREKAFWGSVKTVNIEEQGPLKVVLCVKGVFEDAAGELFRGGDARPYLLKDKTIPKAENYPLSYTARIYAYRGKGEIRIDYTLENDGNGIATYYPINDVFKDGS